MREREASLEEREASLEDREASLEERQASLDQKELRLKKATAKVEMHIELETKQNLQAAEEVRDILLFSPFLNVSLRRVGHYLCLSVLLGWCHNFCHLVFIYVSLYVIPPSLFRLTSA